MMAPLSTPLQRLGRHAWLHKSVRTLLVVAPGLGFFVSSGEACGVMFAFAALCLSVPYGDRSFRPVHLAGCAVASGLLMPSVVWLQSHPALYIPVLAVAGVDHVLVSRAAILPPRVPIWVLIYLLYEGSELRGEGWSTVVTAALLVAPAALWVYVGCFYLWPWRGEETDGRVAGAAEPGMSVPVHAVCAALSMASAAAVTFAFHLPHPNWAIWSSLTVIRPARAVSLRRSAERLAGAVIGCALGLGAVQALGAEPRVLAALTVVVVLFMVAFEQYTLAVAIRSVLAPLAAFALGNDTLVAGQARFLCILIGVAIGTTFMLILSSDRLSGVSERLLKSIGGGAVPRTR
jgi:Fusaric acid resistance protein-like